MSGSGGGDKGDTTTDFVAEAIPAGKYLQNPYEDWAAGEGVPILTGRAVDLLRAPTRPWPRFDCAGAIAHVDGRCDFLTVFVHDIAAGMAAAPQRHLYDELALVLSGTGETEIDHPDGGARLVPWGPGTLIGPPANTRYRHRNTGATPARLACFNDLRYLLSLYRNERFIFDNPVVLPAPPAAALVRGPDAGAAGPIALGSGTIGADLVELGAGSGGSAAVRPARRQMQGAHFVGLGGEGRTLWWREGAEAGPLEVAWRRGVVIGLPAMHFHRHLAAGKGTAAGLDVQLGSCAVPMLRSRRNHYGDKSVYASGSAEIP